jgi:Zn finger protein HypA/HybF involved in hydrogenase expression
MHDLHEADKILKLVINYARQNNARKVNWIYLKLGQIIEHGDLILEKNLKFNLSALAKGTIAEDMDIFIEKSMVDYWELVEMDID